MKHSVHEKLPSFVHADTNTKADNLATKFLESVDSAGIIQQQMCGQSYDGASVMSGYLSGVQTRIRAIISRTQYVQCHPSVLNLCIVVHSSKVRIVRNVMDTMTEISLSFKIIAKKPLEYQEQLEKQCSFQRRHSVKLVGHPGSTVCLCL